MMRKLASTGIAAAEIDGMTIHSFLGEQRNSGKSRTIKPGDSKLEKEWRLIESFKKKFNNVWHAL